MRDPHLPLPVLRSENDGIAGTLRIGPIPASSLQALKVAMERHGLHVAMSPDAISGALSHDEDGAPMITAFARGRGVLGYLVEEDGTEADPALLARCFEEALPAGRIVNIKGTHMPGGHMRVFTRVDVSVEEDGAHFSRSQSIRRIGGSDLDPEPSPW